MSDETTPSQPSLASLLQGQPAAKPAAADAVAPAAVTAPQPAVAAEDAPSIATSQPLFDDSIGHTPDEDGLSPLESAAIAVPATAVAPSFLRGGRQAATPVPATPRWQWGLVIALGLLLAVQVIIADRAKLAADASTRPLVSALCAVLRCSLPAWHEPSAYTMLSREIRPVPAQPGVLQVQASFRNEARWEQSWPALRLSLSDADGRVIGRRTLQPSEYLGTTADASGRLAPGQSAQVSFRLREPAAATVAFSFEFQ